MSKTAGKQTPKHTVNRKDAAKILGVSVWMVRQLEFGGELPRGGITSNGTIFYQRALVTGCARDRKRVPATSGEVSAAALVMFRDGSSVGDVVIELRIPPARALRLAELAGCVTLSAAELAQLDALLVGAGFPKVEDGQALRQSIGELCETVREIYAHQIAESAKLSAVEQDRDQ